MSQAAELALEAALAASGQRPTVLVIDSLQRFAKYVDEDEVEVRDYAEVEQGDSPAMIDLLALKYLKQTKSKRIIDPEDVEVAELSWKPTWEEYLEPKRLRELEKQFDEAPWKDEVVQPSHIQQETGKIDDRRKWSYFYSQTAFRSGTHYIFLETGTDTFDIAPLGPVGYVVANGQGGAYERVKARIQMGSALVLLHNTGGVAQAFGSLHRALLSSYDTSTCALLDKLDLVSREDWAKDFGVAEIAMMKELNQRAPQLLRKTITQVDVLEDPAEHVLALLTCCFASGGGVPEPGLGEAETMTSITSWRRHLLLYSNSRRYALRAHFLQLTTYMLGIFTTFLATMYTKDPDSSLINRSIIVLPIVTGLLATTRSRLRHREKGASCDMAAAKIVAEIYKYRLRVLDYDTTAQPVAEDDDGKEAAVLGPKQLEQRCRERFVDRVQAIYTAVLMSEVSKGGALSNNKKLRREWTSTRVQPSSGEGEPHQPPRWKDDLFLHVQTNLYGKSGAAARALLGSHKHDEQKTRKAAAAAAKAAVEKEKEKKKQSAGSPLRAMGHAATGAATGLSLFGGFGEGVHSKEDAQRRALQMMVETVDDFSAPLQAETYVEQRVRPVCEMLERLAPRMALQLQVLEMTGILAQASGAILAVMGLAEWVAVSAAVALVLQSLVDYFYLSPIVVAVNDALQQVHNLISWWDSLSLIQRKSRAVKARCASVLEGALLQIIAARTGLAVGETQAQADEEEAAAGKEGSWQFVRNGGKKEA